MSTIRPIQQTVVPVPSPWRHFTAFTAAASVLLVAATCAAAPAAAEPCVVDALGRVATNFPPGCTPPPAAPATTAPSTGSSSGGLSGFVSEHAGLIVFVVLGLIAWAVIAGLRSEAADKEKATAEERQASLDRGRAIAQNRHAEEVQAAHDAVALLRPDPSVYDPDGIGLAPPPMPAPVLPDPPPQSDADLRRYAEFNAVVPWIPGSAFAAVVTRDGDLAPAETAWFEAARAARCGEFDAETNTFTPAATLARVEQLSNGEDAVLIVTPRDIFVTDQALNKALAFLVKTAHVRSAAPFTRDHDTGNYRTMLTNNGAPPQTAAPQQVAPAQQAAAYNDDDDWI